MKSTCKYFVSVMLGLVAISLSSAGILVAGVAAGIKTGMWLFWYITLYGTFAAILIAALATIIFFIGYHAENGFMEPQPSDAVDSKAGGVVFG